MSDFDAIIIGSGAGGLAAAVSLARAGKKVCVLEQHYLPGGWCHSFTLEGYRFSPGVHYIGELGDGGQMRRIYEGLGVANHMAFCELNPDGFDHLAIGGEHFDIPKGKDAYADRLCQRFPKEAKGIRSLLDLWDGIGRELGQAMEIQPGIDLVKLPFQIPKTMRYGLRPLGKVMDHYVKDPLLRAFMTIQAGDHGVSPDRVPTAMHAAVVSHYFNGGYYPKGGAFVIPRAFMRELKRNGGEIRLKTTVDRILLEDKRAIGVKLASGDEMRSNCIVSNADPHVTYGKLVGFENLPRFLRWRLKKTTYSISALSLFLAVDMDVRAAGMDSGNYWWSPHCNVGNFDGAFLTCTTLKDPTKRRDNLHTMESFNFVNYTDFERWAHTEYGDRPDDYARLKEDLTARMLETCDKMVPGLSDHVVFSSLGTPVTNEHYVASTRGNLYGTDKKLFQIGPFAYQPKTPFQNLWMCGASTLGHGVMGATVSGLVTAAKILKTSPSKLLNPKGQNLKIIDVTPKIEQFAA
jgi:all-trans-retinol 13,14-reductase